MVHTMEVRCGGRAQYHTCMHGHRASQLSTLYIRRTLLPSRRPLLSCGTYLRRAPSLYGIATLVAVCGGVFCATFCALSDLGNGAPLMRMCLDIGRCSRSHNCPSNAMLSWPPSTYVFRAAWQWRHTAAPSIAPRRRQLDDHREHGAPREGEGAQIGGITKYKRRGTFLITPKWYMLACIS